MELHNLLRRPRSPFHLLSLYKNNALSSFVLRRHHVLREKGLVSIVFIRNAITQKRFSSFIDRADLIMHKENTVIYGTQLNPYLPFRCVTIFASIPTQSHPAAREIPNAP